MSKILVADDNLALANLMEFVMRRSGFDVTVAHRGDKAWVECQRQTFDVIVLDQQMPGLKGTEVVQKLRSSGPNMQTPVYLCTAKSFEMELEVSQGALPISGIFHKPFSPRDLVDKLIGQLALTAPTS